MYKDTVIDCDVHHNWTSQAELLPYLSRGWREFIEGPVHSGPLPLVPRAGFANPHGFDRRDAVPPNGGLPGSDYEMMREQLLDHNNVERAILTYGDVMWIDCQRNPHLAAEIARAANDWTIEKWLDKDERFYGSILISNQWPEAAAAEIRRLGDHPRMKQVFMATNGIGRPFGHPLFHPIYEAAAEKGLPVAIHAGGDIGTPSPEAAGGRLSLYLEFHVLTIQAMMTSLVSFVTNGVFEKYPDLKLVMLEGGLAWIPALLWKFDMEYKGLRREVPWLRKMPSEYVREHVYFSTQPLEHTQKREHLINVLDSIGAEDFLIYASDYPHWDYDATSYIASRFPKSWHRKVFRENAAKLYGLDSKLDAGIEDSANAQLS